MPAGPYLPHGTTFRFNNILVGGLIGISVPSRARGAAETTDSDSNFDRRFIPGLRDGGEVELTFRHLADNTGQQELDENWELNGTAAVKACLLTLPDVSTSGAGGGTYAFDGFVIAPPQGEMALTDDAVAERTCTIKVTGPVTILPS